MYTAQRMMTNRAITMEYCSYLARACFACHSSDQLFSLFLPTEWRNKMGTFWNFPFTWSAFERLALRSPCLLVFPCVSHFLSFSFTLPFALLAFHGSSPHLDPWTSSAELINQIEYESTWTNSKNTHIEIRGYLSLSCGGRQRPWKKTIDETMC